MYCTVLLQVEKIPETAADISPYATSEVQTLPLRCAGGGAGGGAGGRTLERRGERDTLRLGALARAGQGAGQYRPRRRYSESEEYDSDTDTDRQARYFVLA